MYYYQVVHLELERGTLSSSPERVSVSFSLTKMRLKVSLPKMKSRGWESTAVTLFMTLGPWAMFPKLKIYLQPLIPIWRAKMWRFWSIMWPNFNMKNLQIVLWERFSGLPMWTAMPKPFWAIIFWKNLLQGLSNQPLSALELMLPSPKTQGMFFDCDTHHTK